MGTQRRYQMDTQTIHSRARGQSDVLSIRMSQVSRSRVSRYVLRLVAVNGETVLPISNFQQLFQRLTATYYSDCTIPLAHRRRRR